MQSHIRRDRALIALLIAGVALNIGAVSMASRRAYSRPGVIKLPADVDGWKAEDVPTLDGTQAILPHARITTAGYEKPGQIGFLASVIASRDPNDLHTPERCFTGYGATISDRETLPLAISGPNAGTWTMNKMVTRDSTSHDLILYCYDNVPNLGSAWTARVVMKLMPLKEPAYFIRFSTPIEADVPTAQKRLMAFAAKYMEARHNWETPTTAQ